MEGGNEATNGSGITHSPERRTKPGCETPGKSHAEARRRGGGGSFKKFLCDLCVLCGLKILCCEMRYFILRTKRNYVHYANSVTAFH